MRCTGDEALVRYFQYQDNNNLLDSDEEENLDDQLMGYNSDSGEDSSMTMKLRELHQVMINNNKPKAFNSRQGMFKYMNLFLFFFFLFCFLNQV